MVDRAASPQMLERFRGVVAVSGGLTVRAGPTPTLSAQRLHRMELNAVAADTGVPDNSADNAALHSRRRASLAKSENSKLNQSYLYPAIFIQILSTPHWLAQLQYIEQY